MKFLNKTVLITGGSSGIGLECARLFLSLGARVCITGRLQPKLDAAVRELRPEPGTLLTLPGDVCLPEDCRMMVEKTAEAWGSLDVVINSAGVWLEGPAENVQPEDWDRVMDTNLKGTFFICRYAIPCLEKARGCIVNISSDSGLVGNDSAAVYCASKGGVTLLTKSLAVELARKNIRVNAVCPGDVDTPMLQKAQAESGEEAESYREGLLSVYPERPGRRFTLPEEVARCVVFLASPEIEAVTGACLPVDFGLTAGY